MTQSNKKQMDKEKRLVIHESRLDSMNKIIDDISERLDELEDVNEKLNEKMEEIKKENDRLRGQVIADNNINNISDAERVILSDWDSVSVRVTKNKKRAVSVVRNWSDVSWRNRNGDQVMRFSELEDYLEVRFTNAERVAKFVEQMTNGKIVRMESEKNDMVLIQKEDLATEVDQINN